MERRIAAAIVVAAVAVASAQTKRPPAKRPASTPLPATQKVAPEISCPSPLGVGLTTKRAYCDVMTERDPEKGILIALPPHKGPVTLTFDLHNRHTYSEEQVKANRAFARYTATVGVLTMDNTLISRADGSERISTGIRPGRAYWRRRRSRRRQSRRADRERADLGRDSRSRAEGDNSRRETRVRSASTVTRRMCLQGARLRSSAT